MYKTQRIWRSVYNWGTTTTTYVLNTSLTSESLLCLWQLSTKRTCLVTFMPLAW